ncbi:hypothetical protein [Actinomadura sp. 7K507]|uniref:hypothetical protein n=1 Tax=Actinomadura sp. 7K507 TaxID=2530365 RepID=UPI001404FD43|nr:hypothetical protein [Actinomadura sp. 7K507]
MVIGIVVAVALTLASAPIVSACVAGLMAFLASSALILTIMGFSGFFGPDERKPEGEH